MIIDAKGKPCPMPVIMAKQALSGGAQELSVQVDNTTAVENLTRLGESLGLHVSSEENSSDYTVHFRGKAAPAAQKGGGGTAVFIRNDCIGSEQGGSGELGRNLMRMALYTLSTWEQPPESVLLMNTGVRLCSGEDPEARESLLKLAANGARVMVCGTCLNFYGIAHDGIAGQVSNMQDILEAMSCAGRVIPL